MTFAEHLQKFRDAGDPPDEVMPDNYMYWFKPGSNRELHKTGGGPAAIAYYNGVLVTEWWFENGRSHRVNGPAIRTDHLEEWYLEGRRHRLCGPAYEYTDPERTKDCFYYVDGIRTSKEEFERLYPIHGKELILEL